MSKELTLLCLRYDLRLQDNPALNWALERGDVLVAFIFDKKYPIGSASAWWLEKALVSLNTDMQGKLNFYCGDTTTVIQDIIKRHGVDNVVWNRVYEPDRIEDDKKLKAHIKDSLGLQCLSFNASLLWEPWTILKKDTTPYKVFSPFYYKGAQSAPEPRMVIESVIDHSKFILSDASSALEDLQISPKGRWIDKLDNNWDVSEQGALKKLASFLENGLQGYKVLRNNPALDQHTSKLSPYIHFGMLSPHQIWHQAQSLDGHVDSKDLSHFLSELGWREFSYYLLYHFPEIIKDNFQSKFDAYPWQTDDELIELWQKGLTGYPIVDAGMRELYETGYMHNRVRMITASFLVKNLLQHWHHGRNWFDECLVDADLASNNASWQWVAGCGADAAPYFRIFNPVLQGEKFDSQGDYTRKWVPELSNLPNKYLFKPWEAPLEVLEEAGVKLGHSYPKALVDVASSRDKALALYSQYVKGQ